MVEVEIVHTLIVEYLTRIPTCFIHSFRDEYPFSLRELEIDITELWCLMPDTRTISIRDEVCMVDLMILLPVFLIVILWKWWNISESDEIRSFEFSDDRIFSLSLEYYLETILRDDELLIIICYEYIIDIISDRECHIRRDRPRSRRPGENFRSCGECIIRLKFEFHCDSRIIHCLIRIIHRDFEVRYRCSELP